MTERCCHCDDIKEEANQEEWHKNNCSGEVMCSHCYEEMYDYLTGEDWGNE